MRLTIKATEMQYISQGHCVEEGKETGTECCGTKVITDSLKRSLRKRGQWKSRNDNFIEAKQSEQSKEGGVFT